MSFVHNLRSNATQFYVYKSVFGVENGVLAHARLQVFYGLNYQYPYDVIHIYTICAEINPLPAKPAFLLNLNIATCV